jgi:hypothetical protein
MHHHGAIMAEDNRRLKDEIRALHQELAQLRRHRMVRVYQSPVRALLFRFASGLAVGLGTVLGATVLLSLMIWALSQIEFIPIIGDWAVRIAQEIRILTDQSQ